MPSVHLPYINIALDSFALLITLIVLASCSKEVTRKNARAKYFLFELVAISIALVADIVAWFCEGHLFLSNITVISNTVAVCAGQIVIFALWDISRKICTRAVVRRRLY